MHFEETIAFEPVSLKRHRHVMGGTRTYDPSSKDKQLFVEAIGNKDAFETPMTHPIVCTLYFYCKRPKSHFGTKRGQPYLRPDAPKYNRCNKDLDNMVKFVLDALNGKLYVDDCQIVEIVCKKLYVVNPLDSGSIYARFTEIVD